MAMGFGGRSRHDPVDTNSTGYDLQHFPGRYYPHQSLGVAQSNCFDRVKMIGSILTSLS